MNKKKEIFNYLLFGGLTTLVNIVTYYVAAEFFSVDYKISTTIAWITSVLFAYVTNKIYVFQSRQVSFVQIVREFAYFIAFRILSYFIDIFSMIVMVELLFINDLISKIAANVFVVIFNYFASKYIIFREKSSIEKNHTN